jgi:branched-chain amino acid transport system ATP-binding protein
LPRTARLKADPDATVVDRAPAMVELVDIEAGYGAQRVLHKLSISVEAGQVAVLLGLNGAGKSTAMKVLCGAVTPTAGTVRVDGEDLTGWATARCVRAGVVMVPEGRHVFGDLSVDRNLQVGSWTQRSDRAWVASQRDYVFEVLPRLAERRDQLAGTLSGGEQQMLAMGRALMARPKVLVVDEASLGLAPVIVKEILKICRALADDGTTVLLVEQNVGALEVADVGYFVDQGRVTAELRGKQLRDGDKIRKLYLG